MSNTAERELEIAVHCFTRTVRLEADLGGSTPSINIFIDGTLAGAVGIDLFSFGDVTLEGDMKSKRPGVLDYIVSDGYGNNIHSHQAQFEWTKIGAADRSFGPGGWELKEDE